MRSTEPRQLASAFTALVTVVGPRVLAVVSTKAKYVAC